MMVFAFASEGLDAQEPPVPDTDRAGRHRSRPSRWVSRHVVRRELNAPVQGVGMGAQRGAPGFLRQELSARDTLLGQPLERPVRIASPRILLLFRSKCNVRCCRQASYGWLASLALFYSLAAELGR